MDRVENLQLSQNFIGHDQQVICMMDERTLAVISLKLKASVIFAISSLAYCGVAAAPFLHDDKPAILNNPDVQVSDD